ncbi:MAG: PAS domain S-box protein [Thermodesulfobacteriota bacterium]
MIKRAKTTIYSDLAVSLAIVISLVSLVIIAMIYAFLKQNSESIWRQKTEQLVMYLQNSLELPVWNVDENSINRICSVILENELVTELRVSDPHGMIFFEGQKNVGPAVVKRHEKIYYERFHIGNLFIGMSPKAYEEQNHRLMWISVTSFFVIILVMVTATGILLRIFLRNPLEQLIKRIERIGRGDYHAETTPVRQIELQSIINDFNEMAREIEKRETNLTEVNKRLEQEVREREEAAEALKMTQQSYQEIFNGTNDAIIIYDPKSRTIIDVNRSLLLMFGCEYEEAFGMAAGDFSYGKPPYTQEFAREWLRKTMTEGPQLFEWLSRRKNGELFWSEISLTASRIGGRECILAAIRDISPRKKVEEELAKIQSLMLTAIEHSPAGIIVADAPDVKIRIANSAALGIRQGSSQALTDIPVELHPDRWVVYHPDGTPLKPEELPLTQAVLHGRTLRNMEIILQRPDGSKRWVLANAAPITNAVGKIIAGIVVFPDITDQKQAERELRESEEKLNTILKSIPDIVYRLDPEGRIEFISEAVIAYGYAPEDLIGSSIMELVHPDDREAAASRINERKTGKQKTKHLEIRFLPKAPHQAPPQFAITAEGLYQRDAAGREIFIGTQGIARDISDRLRMKQEKEKLEAELRQAQKMEAIGTLAGGIAHDFNNILSAIFGYAQLAQRYTAENPKIVQYLDHIHSASQRAKSLVQQILLFSRQERSQKIPCDISIIIKEALKLLRATLPATIEIRQYIASNQGIVVADQTQIHQVLMNLCTNAAHAMQEKGGILEVSLTAEEVVNEGVAGRYLKLSVSDTGCGMDKATMERIFEPYFTTKNVGDGTGMGLAMVHGIVKAHGGMITVASESGRGTLFEVFFPVIQAEVDAGASEPEAVPTGSEHVLFVDDEHFLVDIGKDMLEALGYSVETHIDPLAAFEAFRADPDRFDLLITDLTMPHMNGELLITEIRKIRPGFPAVLCTGFGRRLGGNHLEEMGQVQVMNKPIRLADLARVVRETLDKNR